MIGNESSLRLVQKALKLISDDDSKEEGLALLKSVLEKNDEQIVAFGYDQVIFQELNKMVQFETETYLENVLEILESFYYSNKECFDDLAEQLIYRVARSTDVRTSKLCLEKISSLVDAFDDSIAKHSKQLLKLADLNEVPDLNPILSEILIKMQDKLPQRKTVKV